MVVLGQFSINLNEKIERKKRHSTVKYPLSRGFLSHYGGCNLAHVQPMTMPL